MTMAFTGGKVEVDPLASSGTHFNYMKEPKIGVLTQFDDEFKNSDAQTLQAYRIQMQRDFDQSLEMTDQPG